MPGLPFQNFIQQGNHEAGAQPQVQTDGLQTSQSPPSPETPSEENKIPDARKVSDPFMPSAEGKVEIQLTRYKSNLPSKDSKQPGAPGNMCWQDQGRLRLRENFKNRLSEKLLPIRDVSMFFLCCPPQGNEKKNDQPPEAKKPKMKVKNVELPIEANLVWQLGRDLLNMYIETEVCEMRVGHCIYK